LRSEAPNSVRRIVTIDDENGKSVAIHDGPTPDVHTDPARPGFASRRIWVTDTTPARVAHAHDPLALPHTLEPSPHGSVCRIVTVPPDAAITMKIQAKYADDDVVKGRNIDVDTVNGVVTLKGEVDTKRERDAAEQLARETSGVKRVIDELKVATH